METSRTQTRSEGPFHQTTVDLPGADPIAFLRALEGEPRGFWGDKDRWVAWGGAFARVEVFSPSGFTRFEQVRNESQRILRRIYADWSAFPYRERPRLFGGFSFLETGGDDPVWNGFPVASFILPRVILESTGGAPKLRSAGVVFGGMRGVDIETEQLAERLITALGGPDGAPTVEAVTTPPPPLAPAPRNDASDDADAEVREAWREAIEGILASIEAGEIRKAVLARAMDVRFPDPVDSLGSLAFLRRENARTQVYLFEPHPGRVFLGAAPEILAEVRRGRFRATAVAGSMPRGGTDDEDLELATELLASEKDRSEHRFTEDEMTSVLGPLLSEMDVEEEPHVLALARIQHLETVISGVPGEGSDILSLVEELHPTPAVCGSPRQEALEVIRGMEGFDRGWYAGPIGWFDAAGEGEFVPGLRSGVGFGNRWRLFAGAGVVPGSDPDAEWAETALKFEPALRALRVGAGVSPDIP